MKIVKPFTFTAVAPYAKTSSGVTFPESGTTSYASGTPYALNDKVSMASDSSTVTMTAATPCVVTWTAHELVAGDMISFTTTGVLHKGIEVSKMYFVREVLTVDTFTLTFADDSFAAVSTSTWRVQSGTHTGVVYVYKKYISLQAPNTGRNPRKASNAAWWASLGAINQHAMFDGTITSKTTFHEIDVTLTVSYPMDVIVLMGLGGASCLVTCTDGTLGVVYNVSHTIWTSINGIYEDITELVITDIPTFSSGTIRIIVTRGSALDPIAVCEVGAVLIGKAYEVGGTSYGASIGIQDFSTIDADTFGNYDIVERAYSKRASLQVMVATADLAYTYNQLAKLRARKTLFIGDTNYGTTAIYGFPSDWSIVIQYQNYALLNIDIKGLT